MAYRLSIKWLSLLAAFFVLLGVAVGCQRTDPPPAAPTTTTTATAVRITSLTIEADERVYMPQGGTLQLKTNHPDEVAQYFTWSSSNAVVTVKNGLVTAQDYGKAVVTVSYGGFSAKVMIEVTPQEEQVGSTTYGQPPTRPSQPQSKPTYYPDNDLPEDNEDDGTGGDLPLLFDYDRFYQNSTPASGYSDALQRSLRGELSGSTVVPDEAPTLSAYRPMQGGKYVHNTRSYYADDNTYVVVDAYGYEAFRIYRGGGYITLEEVAAYVYAFGDVPANYVSGKKTDPDESKWGEYLRLNHTKFSGSTKKYPYEPELPRISGCGGYLQYYEIDIGTTGTTAGEGYEVRTYNNGSSIVRGAARIVYARFDANGDLVVDEDEKFVFYTYNHYNDFQQYLNYYGGWGEMFGNITGGGTLSSKRDYNPTPYVAVVLAELLPNIGGGPAWDEAA